MKNKKYYFCNELKRMSKKDLQKLFSELQSENSLLRAQLESVETSLHLIEPTKDIKPECASCIFAPVITVPTHLGSEVWILGCTKKNRCSDYQSRQKVEKS